MKEQYHISNSFTEESVNFNCAKEMWDYLDRQHVASKGKHYFIEVNITSFRGIIVLLWCWCNGVSVMYRFGKIVISVPRDT